MKMAPATSGLKPYENALGASGSSMMIREYGGPAMTCDGADQLLFISWHTYLAVWGHGLEGALQEEAAGRHRHLVRARQALGTSCHPACGITALRLLRVSLTQV